MTRNADLRQLTAENRGLRARLERAEESVREILSGESDALFVPGADGAQLFTLKGADQSYRTLIENMSEGALTLTLEGLILYANRRFAQMLVTSLERVIGSEIHTWFAPESRAALQTLLQKDAVANRSEELLLAAADGTQVPVYLSVSHLLLDKMPDCFCMVATDLTEQKRNEAILAAEEFARAILEQAADAIVICDRTGRIIRASKQAQALCGKNPLGRPFEHAFPLRQFNGAGFSPVGAIDTTHRQSVEASLEHGGQQFDLLVSVGHLTDARNEMLGSVVTLTDITERKLAEKEVRESEERFRTLANSIPQLAWMARADGFLFWYNQRWHDYTGTTPEQMEGLGWQSVHDPAGLPAVLSRWREAIALAQPFEMEFPLRGADGTFRNFLARGQPMNDSGGRLVQWFGTCTDVDQLKRIEQSLRVTQARLESTLRASSVGTWTWDLASDRLMADECTARMYSIAASAAAKGLPAAAYLQAVHEEDRTDVADALERAIALCGAYDIEYRVRQGDGAVRWLQARGRVESDGAGDAAYFHGAVIDITNRKILELSMRDKNQLLESSNRDLEDFAYIASHDLKTPLSGIKSAALWLEEDLHDLSDESRKLLGLMRNRIMRMETLLDDLLAFSRVGRSGTTVSETKLADIFASIMEVVNPPAHIQVRVEGELPVIVTASAQLEQVLRNLIGNAIKHHDKPKGEVVLSATRVGEFVEFIVRDDGPGILPQFHEKIFQLFQTLKRRGEVESTGMGLAIVKKLVERQNCRITVHSQGNGTGTEFRFRWPTSSSTIYAKEPTNA
jgi:PAS domain S-box-containing protein